MGGQHSPRAEELRHLGMATIDLNLFRLTIEPDLCTFPAKTLSSWEESNQLAKGALRDITFARFQVNDHVDVVAIADREIPGFTATEIALKDNYNVTLRLLRKTITDYFVGLGHKIIRGKFATTVLHQSADIQTGWVHVHTGVSIRPLRPFSSQPLEWYLAASWTVHAAFQTSLADPILRSMAIGRGVIYRSSDNSLPLLSPYRGKFLGHVRDLKDDDAVILCRDKTLRAIPFSSLYLEASPSTIREYETRLSTPPRAKTTWQRMQELSLVLNAELRRNPSVLRDRMSAVRRFLGRGAFDTIELKASALSATKITLSLDPTRAAVSNYV